MRYEHRHLKGLEGDARTLLLAIIDHFGEQCDLGFTRDQFRDAALELIHSGRARLVMDEDQNVDFVPTVLKAKADA